MLKLQSSLLPNLPDEAKKLINMGIYSLFQKNESEYILITNTKKSYLLNKDGGFKMETDFEIPRKDFMLVHFKNHNEM